MGSESGGGLELEQADVVGDGEAVVVLVKDDLGDLDVLLVWVGGVELVGSNGYSQTAGRLSAKKKSYLHVLKSGRVVCLSSDTLSIHLQDMLKA